MMKDLLHYFPKVQKKYNSGKNIVQNSITNNSNSAVTSPVASTSAYSVSQHKGNKLPPSHHSLVRESNPIVNEREENTNKMRHSSIDKAPRVSPQGNFVSRSDQRINPALSKCNESKDVCAQCKVGVPNQANKSERTKIGNKKGLGVLNNAMVEYMERYGDISKCHDKVLLIQKWEELTKTLNAQTNANRSSEQWKRKWRYLRHHATQKKEDIANGLAGGADANSTYKLADLARILKIIESPIVTDRHDVEEGPVAPINTHMLAENPEEPETQAFLPEPPTHLTNIHHELPSEQVMQTEGSRESSQVDREEDRPVESITHTQQSHVGPQRRRLVRRRLPPSWRRNRSAQADAIADKFHTLVEDFASEHIRLRRLELEQQAQFTTSFTRFVNLLENLRNQES